MSSTPESLSPPQPLTPEHDVSRFSCGEAMLDDWLRRRAWQNQASGASRTYVVCAGTQVVGFYALAVGAVEHDRAPGKVKRNMPDPVPVMVLARLAVDRNFQGRGVASGLLRDAILRTLNASKLAGIRAILVHAISDDARKFYEAHGFSQSPLDAMTLMITLKEAENALLGKL